MITERITLRDYQEETLKTVRAYYDDGIGRILIPAATGLGKTITFSYLPDFFPELFERGMLILVHREELVQQAADKFLKVWPWANVQIEQAKNYANPDAPVVVASVQTLGRGGSRRITKFEGRFGIVVVDEAHHITVGSQYDRVLEYFGLTSAPANQNGQTAGGNGVAHAPDRLLVGVTATPNRHDGQGLHHFFDEIGPNLDLRWGVENGWLTDIRAVKVDTKTDISDVRTRAGDFALNELDEAVNTHMRNEVIVKGYKDHGGKQAIAFCTTIQHALDLAGVFEGYGVRAECVHSKMEHEDRVRIVEGFRSGDFPVLTNVGIATEGFDVPEIDTILMARPTKSTMLYQQCIGRGTRPIIDLSGYEDAEERIQGIRASEKPHMMIIDYTDNSGNHPLITMPTLFGLTKKFDYKGESVIKAEMIIEELEEKHPTKNVRKGKDLDDVHIIAKTMTLWDVAEDAEVSAKGLSNFTWLNLSNGAAQIVIPGSKIDGKRNVVARVERDRLGRYSVIAHMPSYFDSDRGFRVSSRTVRSTKLYPSKKEAIAGVDKWIERDFHEVTHLLDRRAGWRLKPASDKQVAFLKKRHKVEIPEELTSGQASALIQKAIIDSTS